MDGFILKSRLVFDKPYSADNADEACPDNNTALL